MRQLEINTYTRSDLEITDKHFGTNVIVQDTVNQVVNGVPTQSFMAAINALDISDIRYPAGAPDAAYADGILINNELPEHLVNFMDAMAADGRQVVVVTPTFGSYTNAAEMQRFAELLLRDYAPTIRAFEIGNEYWQQQGETDYGQIANETTLAISAASDLVGRDADIWVQMANAGAVGSEFLNHPTLGWQPRTVEANKTIIAQLSDEALAQIDGVVEHGYFREEGQTFGPLEESTTMIWLDVQTWREELGKELDLAITEWNVKTNNEGQHGLKAASSLLFHFENLITLGADDMHIWAAQHNTKTDLAGTGDVLFDDDTGIVNNSVNGVIFDLLSTNLVGKELLDLDLLGDQTFINTHAYADDNQMVVYVASRSNETETVQFSTGSLVPEAALESALLISYDNSPESSDGVRFSTSSGGFVAADFLMVDGERHYINEHDARGSVDVLDLAEVRDGTSALFTLKPYEVVQLTYNIAERELVNGTSGNDNLSYGAGSQFVRALEGNDTIDGGQGADTIFGGEGNDRIVGGAGPDAIAGQGGNDYLSGWGGHDDMSGGEGDDILFGFQGNDELDGGSGNDMLRGDEGNDTLLGQSGFDTLEGGDGQDSLYGGNSADRILGGEGNDTIYGGSGFDQLSGGNGSDLLDGGADSDLISGGLGNDQISDLYGNNRVFGGGGFDTITTGAGNDTIFGENHADRISGGAGDDMLNGGWGFDILSGDAGNDILDGGIHNDRLMGGSGDDTLYGQAGFDFLEGGMGHDALYGGNQADRMTGGFGNDVMDGGDGLDYLFGGNQNDTIDGGADADTVIGGNGNDLIQGGTGDDRMLGGTGDDLIFGQDGNDNIFAGAGFDIIEGGAGDDRLFGNFNADTFVFAAGHGNDVIGDFEQGNANEKIDLSALSVPDDGGSWLDSMSQNGGDVVIDTGAASSITIVGTDVDTIFSQHLLV